jgi:large subunit ribosomal protein L17
MLTYLLQTPHDLLPKLFTTLRQRYENRPGGYTRGLRTEPKSTYDQAPSAILEFVDGPKDLRFHMTAAIVARDQKLGRAPNKVTMLNRRKVMRYRDDGQREFEKMVKQMKDFGFGASQEEKETRRRTKQQALEAREDENAAEEGVEAAKPEKKNVSVLR